MASPEPVFVPRVFISDKGSVAIEEPGGHDYVRIVRIAEDLRPRFPDMRYDGAAALPIEALYDPLMGWRFREMVPRGY